MTMKPQALAILDIGKTNVKLSLLDQQGKTLAEQRTPNTIVTAELYPHHDTERIWNWLLANLRAMSETAEITALVPVTHGATAALVDDTGLVLPVLDYEFELPAAQVQDYLKLRPAFDESHSPELPAGLNLGRQLYWLAQACPEQFQRARHILTYPQYWTWRLCGVAASEVTSLGCHTDLWRPHQRDYSSLVKQMGWDALFPPIRPAWSALGAVRADVAAQAGLPQDCQVLCGIHDSNASLWRYLGAVDVQVPGAVLSTGTWVIAASFETPLSQLHESLDMLANVDVAGRPVASTRFMGGREFAHLAGPDFEPCTREDLERLVAQATMALPSFAESGGPFSGRAGEVVGPAPRNAAERYALATLYCVLMSDYCLSALGSSGTVIVEGSFAANPFFAPLLAALRGQPVQCSDDASGTTCGAWLLRYRDACPARDSRDAIALELPGFGGYRTQWREASAMAAPACRQDRSAAPGSPTPGPSPKRPH